MVVRPRPRPDASASSPTVPPPAHVRKEAILHELLAQLMQPLLRNHAVSRQRHLYKMNQRAPEPWTSSGTGWEPRLHLRCASSPLTAAACGPPPVQSCPAGHMASSPTKTPPFPFPKSPTRRTGCDVVHLLAPPQPAWTPERAILRAHNYWVSVICVLLPPGPHWPAILTLHAWLPLGR